MNAVDETSVRDQLEQALSVLDPAPPQLDTLRARAGRRRRTRRVFGGFLVVATAGVAVAVIAAVVTVAPAGRDKIQVAAPPTRDSLVRFATANGALKIAGPFGGNPGWYGVFSTKHAIVVANYVGQQWRPDGPAVTSLGPGRFVTRLSQGPALGSAETPSIAVRTVGGDVTYFGSVLRRGTHRWLPSNFGPCAHHKLCYSPSNSEPYGHPAGDGFVSTSNNCTPYCAAGTNYRITWRWSAPKQKFAAVSERALKR
jgi:hypothetical protein